MGAARVFQMVVSEPEPGRVLVETDKITGQVTTFTVNPRADANQSAVTIATDFQPRPGFAGIMERLFSPPITRRIFKTQLQQLEAYAVQTGKDG